MKPVTKTRSTVKVAPKKEDGSFEVSVVRSLGIVRPTAYGEGTPFAAALSLIARDGDDAEYRFRLPEGPDVTVRIEFDPTDTPR